MLGMHVGQSFPQGPVCSGQDIKTLSRQRNLSRRQILANHRDIQNHYVGDLLQRSLDVAYGLKGVEHTGWDVEAIYNWAVWTVSLKVGKGHLLQIAYLVAKGLRTKAAYPCKGALS